jgi:hypothetical protein
LTAPLGSSGALSVYARIANDRSEESMKQILQSLKSGATEIADVPCPAVGRGKLLIGTTFDLVRS